MTDGSEVHAIESLSVPLRQIHETRRSFPHRSLAYEVLFAVDGWRGIEDLARVFSGAGLGLNALRCSSSGTVICTLSDDGNANLSRVASALGDARNMRLCGWTTVIKF